MNEDTNDMIPEEPVTNLPPSVREQLRTIMSEPDVNQFRDQLPAEFLTDASEGLDHMKDARQLEVVFLQLNKQMRHQLSHKKSKRKRPPIANLSWVYWAIVIICLLTLVAFILIRLTLKHSLP